MSSVFLECVRQLQCAGGSVEKIDKVNTIEFEGKKVSLYTVDGYWPRHGFMIKTDGKSIEGKLLEGKLQPSQALEELTNYINE